MTQKQLDYYLKGGIFSAIYNPKTLDIHDSSKTFIGQKVYIYQSALGSPIISPEKWEGQFFFDCEDIYGRSPEEDFEHLIKIDEFVEPQPLPQYIYKSYFTDPDQIYKNFGNTSYDKLPFIVIREYSYERDNYILTLANPQATKIEKVVWNGEFLKDIKWETIYGTK